MPSNAPIGIIDSGVGGLSVWQEIVKKLPHESTIFLADQRYVPYGPRSKEEITKLSVRLVDYLVSEKVKLIVIACNTISVTCLDILRKHLPHMPIVGTVPVIKTAVSLTKNGNIGVLATKRTAESEYLQNLIQTFANGRTVTIVPAKGLVEYIEQGETMSPEFMKYLEQQLSPFRAKYCDVVVMGSTHFPFIKQQVAKIMGKEVRILDSGPAIARQVERILSANGTLSTAEKPKYSFLTTGDEVRFKEITKLLLKRPLNGQYIQL